MSLLVDTSVWSLAFRRDGQPGVPEVVALAFLQPDKHDHIAAADIRNVCRRRGIQGAWGHRGGVRRGWHWKR